MKIPAAIIMSGTGSNARKILEKFPASYDIRLILSDNPSSNYRLIASDFDVECELNDIYRFYDVPYPDEGIGPEDRKKLKNRKMRETFDRETELILKKYEIRLIATAGYDWIMSPFLCRNYLIVNVHPGDLRVVDEQGRRKYIGLGWIPTAKAILNGEKSVYSSTHLVTAELDGGPVGRVSAPVQVNLPTGITTEKLLPAGISLGDVIRDVNGRAGKQFGDLLIYTLSKKLQEKLKKTGDWVEFPKTLHMAAEYMLGNRLVLREGQTLLDGKPPDDLFLMKGDVNG